MSERLSSISKEDLEDLENAGKGVVGRSESSDLDDFADLESAGKGDLTRSKESSSPESETPEAVGDVALDGVGIVPTFEELDARLLEAAEEGQRQADALAPPVPRGSGSNHGANYSQPQF